VATIIEFDTPRLSLRRWRQRDRAPFAAMCADPEVMRYFPAVQTQAQCDAAIDRWNAQLAERGWSNWAVERRDDGGFIGFVGLTMPRAALPCSPCVEIGWRLRREAWGQGFATEAAAACLHVGFERLGLAQIHSFTALPNRPSMAVMERIGLRNVHADFEHPSVPPGHPLRMHVLYRVTREEWLEAQANSGSGLKT
jgi:RimJ/RimL family protein N-acetyltransferase